MAFAKTKYNKDGMTVQGNLTVTGTVSATGGLSYTNITLTGNLVVQGNTTLGNAVGDTITVTGTPTFAELVTLTKNLVVGTGVSVTTGGVTVVAGGVTVTAGGLTVTAGGATVAAGNVGVTLGNLTVDAGNIAATLGSITAGAAITAGTTVTGADLVATDDLTVGDDATITDDLIVGGDGSIAGNLGVLGTLACTTFAPANITTGNITASGTLGVTGTATFDGAIVANGSVTIGNAGTDILTVTAQVAGNIEFNGASTHQIIGETDQNIQITAAGTGDVVLATAGAAAAVTVDNVAGLVTLSGALTVGGATSLGGDVTFTPAAACNITATNNQNLVLAATGTGTVTLSTAGSATALVATAAGGVNVAGALTSIGNIQPQVNIAFGGALAHEIIGTSDQNLTVRTQGTGDLILSSAGAGGINIDGATDTITLTSALTSDADANFDGVLSKDGANGSSVHIRVAEGLVNPLTGGGITETIANAIPAGSLVLAVTVRVNEAIVMGGGGTNFDIGIAGATTRYGENIALTLGTTTTLANALAASSPIYYPTATNIVLTGDAGTFTGGGGNGQLRWKVYYINVTAPTG